MSKFTLIHLTLLLKHDIARVLGGALVESQETFEILMRIKLYEKSIPHEIGTRSA